MGSRAFIFGLSLCICAIPAAEHELLSLPPELRAEALHRSLLQTPSVSWPAAEATLLESLPALRIGPHRVLVQLGTDELSPRLRPALEADWWSAVIALCERYDLAVAPSTANGASGGPLTSVQRVPETRSVDLPLRGGPVILAPAHPERAVQLNACGPVLMAIEEVAAVHLSSGDGDRGWADIGYRLRLHPGAPAALISEAELRWERASVDGRELELGLPRRPVTPLAAILAPEPDGRGDDLARLRIRGLQPGDRSVLLEGELTLAARALIDRRISLGIDERLELTLDRVRYEVELRGPGPDQDHAELVITALDPVDEELRIGLFTDGGAPLRASDRSFDASHLRWTQTFRRLPVDRYTLRLSRQLEIGREVLPLRARVQLP